MQRIHALNPRVNAIVNLADDEALLAQARVCDDELAGGQSRGWMHGMPQAIKDTGAAQGFPTTIGSPLLKNVIATRDNVMVSRMKAAGCIVIGKTNLPELGLGSHTFTELFGATPNAWDTQVSAGGSSGATTPSEYFSARLSMAARAASAEANVTRFSSLIILTPAHQGKKYLLPFLEATTLPPVAVPMLPSLCVVFTGATSALVAAKGNAISAAGCSTAEIALAVWSFAGAMIFIG
jgi:hypothetical protein